MKLLKPSWVTHDEKPIFSVDIHPTGKRFATGGQGGDSGRVVVWNLKCLLDEDAEVDPNIPKMLCQMDNHLACVNCVRWSNGGKYLASGGDDKLVMIWALSGSGTSAVFGSNGKLNVETWRCISTLRGHAGDVLDLAWSPHDKWLASCSVDNTIIIWNAEKFPEMVCVLNGHTGLVKGVAWDPVGKYLASQSDDKSLRVWKTADWAQESVITDPFEECGGTTHVLRLSWSPDGQYVVSAHAMNGGGPTAQIVERDGWRCDKDFVGHRKAVTCVRFSSNILSREGKKYCCAAMGSRDRTLSIWLTSLKRPLVVVHELFTDSVLDLSWSSDGLNLLACSWDGSVACIQFTNNEIGLPLSLEERNGLFERKYGKYLVSESTSDNANLLVECPEVLQAREKIAAEESKKDKDSSKDVTPTKLEKQDSSGKNQSNSLPIAQSSPVTPVRPIDRQIETRTSDGKRRITPIFIPLHAPADQNESVASLSASDGCFSSSSQNKSRIRVERRDDIVIHPNVSNHAPPTPIPSDSISAPTTFAGAAIAEPVQNENNLDNRLKRRATAASLPGPKSDEVIKKMRVTSPTPGSVPSTAAVPAVPTVTVSGPGDSTNSNVPVLPAPALGTAGPVVRYAGKYRAQVLNNAFTTPYGKLSRVQLLPANSATSDPIWETFLGSPINCIVFDGTWACVACEDSSLHTWRMVERVARAAPPLALGARVARLALGRCALLAAVTANGRVAVWDLERGEGVLAPVSIRELVPSGVTVSNLTLMDDGSPMISLTNGKGYVYSKKMSAWIICCDGTDPLWICARGSVGRLSASSAPLAALQAATLRYRPRETALQTCSQGPYQLGATVSWLETQISSCLHLRSPREYRHWMTTLASHLMQHGSEKRLRMMLDELLGPSHCTSKPTKWKKEILGISKHDMLEDVLAMLGKQLRWQRLYVEYTDQMEAVKTMLPNGH